MCTASSPTLEELVRGASQAQMQTPADDAVPSAVSTRRRRIWELDNHAHCPVVGVCLPIGAIRRLATKSGLAGCRDGDYDVHCVVVSECKRRSRLAEAVQRELDERYSVALRAVTRIKSTQ